MGRAIRKSGVPREELFVTTKLWVSEYSRAENAIDETLERVIELSGTMMCGGLDRFFQIRSK